jgi:hypothetical protein
MRSAFVLAAVALLVCATEPSRAQQRPKAFVCHFSGGVASVYDSQWQTEPIQEGMDLTFTAFDTAKARAQLLGVLGASEVLMAWGANSVSFVETTTTGDLTLTTIFLHAGKGSPHPAIHSRHIAASGEAVSSQLRGRCEARF